MEKEVSFLDFIVRYSIFDSIFPIVRSGNSMNSFMNLRGKREKSIFLCREYKETVHPSSFPKKGCSPVQTRSTLFQGENIRSTRSLTFIYSILSTCTSSWKLSDKTISERNPASSSISASISIKFPSISHELQEASKNVQK